METVLPSGGSPVGPSRRALPTVAIVGRPNVGKSTLFNRLVGRRQAIVHDLPGVTRDRLAGRAEVAPGQQVHLLDTGGLVPGGGEPGLGRQVAVAIEEADLILFVVDGKAGLTAADERAWEQVRASRRATMLVVNKSDVAAARLGAGEFYRLGAGDPVLVSAEHGLGMDELREELAGRLAAVPAGTEEVLAGLPAVAIVGRPNVGKSSLLNRLLGEERVLVSPLPGTTRDPIDTLVEWGGSSLVLIDTAGIRRRSRVSATPEALAVMMARRQIERADLALLVLDAQEGVTSGDLAIAGEIRQAGRSAVVAVNKWDLLEGDARDRLEGGWERLGEVLARPRRVNLSALTGRGVGRLVPAVAGTLREHRTELSTGRVNRLLQRLAEAHRPPAEGGRPWKLLYATQVGSGPPTFLLFANRGLPRNSPYRRYLEKCLREELGLAGVPVRLVVRRRAARARG